MLRLPSIHQSRLSYRLEQGGRSAKALRLLDLSIGLVALVLVLFAAGSVAFAGSARTHDREVQFSPYVGKLKTLRMVIARREVTMLFDTGAGHTLITPRLANELGCTPFGADIAHRMNGDTVTFSRCAPLQFRLGPIAGEREFAVFDLQAVLPEGLPHLDGVVGLDIFDQRTITLLSGQRGIRFPSSAEVAGLGRPGVLRLGREGSGASLTAFALADTPRGNAWLLIDSGNLAGTRLHQWVFDALSVSGGAPADRHQLAIRGARSIPVDPSMVERLIYDGALGIDYIDDFDLTLDLARSRIWWNQATSRQGQ